MRPLTKHYLFFDVEELCFLLCFIDGHIYDLFKNCTRVSVVILTGSRFLCLRNMTSLCDLDFRVVKLKDLLCTLFLKVGRVYKPFSDLDPVDVEQITNFSHITFDLCL